MSIIAFIPGCAVRNREYRLVSSSSQCPSRGLEPCHCDTDSSTPVQRHTSGVSQVTLVFDCLCRTNPLFNSRLYSLANSGACQMASNINTRYQKHLVQRLLKLASTPEIIGVVWFAASNRVEVIGRAYDGHTLLINLRMKW